jgi:hypothetical protein
VTYTLAIDDFTSDLEARVTTRERVDKHIANEEIEVDPSDASPAEAAEFYRRRDAELRSTWGHDPAAQSQWVK